MNQFNWTYLADNGTQHQVTLMHGATSGHLIVYCNTTIVIIDFGILQSSTYSFFIEEELCELTIERKGDQFLYGFEVNQEAETPLNKERKKQEKKHLFQSIFFLGGILLLVSISIVGMTYYQNPKNQVKLEEKLESKGKETSARVLLTPKLKDKNTSYVFFVDGQSYSGVKEKESLSSKNGFPPQKGDEFLLRYLPGSPLQNQIDFSQPSPETIEKYKLRAIEKYLHLFPDISPDRAKCLIEVAYILKKVDGLAEFHHCNTPFSGGTKYNKDSFLRFIRDLPFEKLAAKNCGFL